MTQRIAPAVWDYLCDLNNGYCGFTWLTGWEKLERKIDVTAEMIHAEAAYNFQLLRQDMKRRFDQLQAEARARNPSLTDREPHDTLTLESPLIGVRPLAGGVREAAPKGSHNAGQRRST